MTLILLHAQWDFDEKIGQNLWLLLPVVEMSDDWTELCELRLVRRSGSLCYAAAISRRRRRQAPTVPRRPLGPTLGEMTKFFLLKSALGHLRQTHIIEIKNKNQPWGCKFMVEKSGVEKSGVEKSGVEKSGVQMCFNLLSREMTFQPRTFDTHDNPKGVSVAK